MEIDIIKSLLTSYFNLCKKKVTDAVPKSIMYFMVKIESRSLGEQLVPLYQNIVSAAYCMVEKVYWQASLHIPRGIGIVS